MENPAPPCPTPRWTIPAAALAVAGVLSIAGGLWMGVSAVHGFLFPPPIKFVGATELWQMKKFTAVGGMFVACAGVCWCRSGLEARSGRRLGTDGWIAGGAAFALVAAGMIRESERYRSVLTRHQQAEQRLQAPLP